MGADFLSEPQDQRSSAPNHMQIISQSMLAINLATDYTFECSRVRHVTQPGAKYETCVLS